jgi:diacylglycerol O-acyltransferase
MPRRERMSPVDTAWLRMDCPGNLMMIVGVDVFDGPCDVERLRRVLQSHLLRHLPFRSRAELDASGAWWVEDEDFDIDQHLVRIGLPGAGGKHELQKLAGQLAGQSLDPTKPLWQFHLVENYDGGHALIVRIHHCIADGIALMGVLLSMTATSPDADDDAPPLPGRGERAGGPNSGPISGPNSGPLWAQVLKPLTDATVKAIDTTGDVATRVLHAYSAMLTDPEVASAAANTYAHTATQIARDAAALALMEPDTPTRLKGRPGGNKVVAWNEPLGLTDVKAVGNALGCSVNDVLLSCAAGALRGYLLDAGDRLGPDAELRAMVPVNLRPPGKPQSLGNKFGLVPLLLPIGMDDPIARVYEVQRRMNELKGGFTAVLAMVILGASGLVPRMLQKQVLDMLARKGTAVMTNVPGPREALYMAGSRLRQMMFWVPQSGDIGMGVSILSYAGGVQFGLVTDKKICAQPQAIIDRFTPEFENLVHAVLLMPWDDAVPRVQAERALHSTEAIARAATHLSRREHAPTALRGTEVAADDAPADAPQVPPRAAPRRRQSAFAAARARK